nr:SKP1-like protein 1A [Tanacetum cinerariifolium]
MLMDGGFNNENIVLSFPNITSEIIVKVLEFCNKHKHYAVPGNNITADYEMKAFDAQFVNVHYETLLKLHLGKTPEEIHKTFNIKNDFTLEEEEEVRRENAWAFE